MGAWGLHTFENDDALDWVEKLQVAKDGSVLARVFARIPKNSAQDLSAPEASRALAAAEVVAALLGKPASSLPGEVTRWVQGQPKFSRELVKEAQLAVRRTLTNSELRELVKESNDFSHWRASVNDLLSRLSSGAVQVEPSAAERRRAGQRRKKPLPDPSPGLMARGGGARRSRPWLSRSTRPVKVAAAAKDDLRDRANRFLQGIVPFESYTSETVTEDFIRRYVAGDSWEDPALHDQLRLCYSVVLNEIDGDDYESYPEAQRGYLNGCAELLHGIMMEIYGESQPYEDLG